MALKASALEERFALAWRAFAPGEDVPEREYRFHATRGWRFDFAWPVYRVAVEIDGGQWQSSGGRHARDADREKLNAAAGLGWRVFRYSGTLLRDPERVIRKVVAALEFV